MRSVVLGLALSFAGSGLLFSHTAGSSLALAGPPQAAPAAQQPDPAPVIPKDAQWTLYCTILNGPGHAAKARLLKDKLVQSTRLRDWYIVQSDEETTLYYGFYPDPKDSRAKRDRETIAAITTANGERLFAQPCLMPLEAADPVAPPEWNLANVKQHYTLEIGVYRDHPQRKEYAVQAVREARAQGVEAYYFHGPTASLVCVGAWPAEAVQEPGEVRAENPNELLVVAGAKPPEDLGDIGKPVRVVQAHAKIVDPTLLDAMKRYPTHLTNGAEVKRKTRNLVTQKVTVITEKSVLIQVPRKEPSRTPLAPANAPVPVAAPADPAAQAAPEPTKAQPARRPPQPPPTGKLRSLED